MGRSGGGGFRAAVWGPSFLPDAPGNIHEAIEIELDIEEGADMIMVKPAMPYLDVIAAQRDRFDLPLAAYQVSGEYAMIEAAARNHWTSTGESVMMKPPCRTPAAPGRASF